MPFKTPPLLTGVLAVCSSFARLLAISRLTALPCLGGDSSAWNFLFGFYFLRKFEERCSSLRAQKPLAYRALPCCWVVGIGGEGGVAQRTQDHLLTVSNVERMMPTSSLASAALACPRRPSIASLPLRHGLRLLAGFVFFFWCLSLVVPYRSVPAVPLASETNARRSIAGVTLSRPRRWRRPVL